MQMHYDQQGTQHNSLINTWNTSGSTFLSHQISARQSVGVQYQFLNLVFPGESSRTTSHSVLLFDQIAVNPHLSFSIFAGPEYSRIHNQLLVDDLFSVVHVPVSRIFWTPAAGATFNWSGERTGLQASFVRRVSDGGGLLGSVEMDNASLQLHRRLTRRWVASLDGEFVRDAPLKMSGNNEMRTLDAGAGISHELTQRMWLRVSYQRMQRSGRYLSSLGFGNHNRVTVSLERTFSVPLGR
jgi:hypothetical protein